jgi:hypothetical protein
MAVMDASSDFDDLNIRGSAIRTVMPSVVGERAFFVAVAAETGHADLTP